VIIRVKSGGEVEAVNLDKAKSSRAELPNAPADAATGEGRRQSNPRTESITDIAFLGRPRDCAGAIKRGVRIHAARPAFPFTKVEGGTSVEIYHGAHGKFETRAPGSHVRSIDRSAMSRRPRGVYVHTAGAVPNP
jgi:hypothetical protein